MKLPFKIDLTNKIAVLTGGAGILCSVMAEALAQCGAKVVILDINYEAAVKLVTTIKKDGGDATAIKIDVLELDSIKNAAKMVGDKFGACDILINGAGGNHPSVTTAMEFLGQMDEGPEDNNIINSYLDMDPHAFEPVFRLNLMSVMSVSQVFSRFMIRAKSGVIINISSVSSYTPLTKIPIYSSAKAAINNFTKWLAVHYSQAGIRVNAIAPGFLLTNQNYDLLIDKEGKHTDRAKKIISRTPKARFGNPEDLLGTLLWLIDNKSSAFVTGITVPVDGGYLAYSGV